MSIKNFFSEAQKEQIKLSIQAAETNTSGEIRVHIEARCKEAPMSRAIKVFEQLKMHKTELRNGVLVYLATEDKKFAILGDKGIDEKVPTGFWDSVKDIMTEEFRKGNFEEGLIKGIGAAGEKLKTFFPYQKDDINELSDEISYGNEKEGGKE